MHTNNTIKLLLIIFSAAIVIVLSVFAYMIISDKPANQAGILNEPIVNDIPQAKKTIKKPAAGIPEATDSNVINEGTAMPENSAVNTESENATENQPEANSEVLNNSNPSNTPTAVPPASQQNTTAPAAKKAQTLSPAAQKYLEEEKAKEELKRKMLEALDK